MENVREELDRLIRQRNVGYSAVSRLLNRNPAYIQQFIKRGSPRKLDDEDRRILAQFFGVDEQVLGGPALPMRDGLVEVPILNVDASAGFGAIAESETAHTRFGFDERWLGKLTRAKGPSLSIIHVHGESMEPTLRDGDEVLVDASDQGSRLRDGIYVLRVDDALVKRLEADAAHFDDLANLLFDQAWLAEGGQLEDPAQHVQRVTRLLTAAA